jgi:hypothetical protein
MTIFEMKNGENSTVYADPFWYRFDTIHKFWYDMMASGYTIYFIIGLPANLAVMIYYIKYEERKERPIVICTFNHF